MPDSFKDAFGEDKQPVSAFTPDTSQLTNFNNTRVNIIYVATRYEVVKIHMAGQKRKAVVARCP